MIIKSLELTDYRNYESLNISFDKGTNILYGDNAQGKTNILEAIYLSATTKSHKLSKDKEIIKFIKDKWYYLRNRREYRTFKITIRKSKNLFEIKRWIKTFGLRIRIFEMKSKSRYNSISIKEYKKQIKTIYKKNHLKFITYHEEIPENVAEIEKKLGWYRGDYCKIKKHKVTLFNEDIPIGCVGKIYAPYSEDKIVIILYHIRRTLAVKPNEMYELTETMVSGELASFPLIIKLENMIFWNPW